MKQIFISFLLTLTTIISHAQMHEKDSVKEYSSADYISSYYNEEFRPFSKGAWYTKLSFSLSDKDLQNSTRLFDRVEAGRGINYSISASAGHFLNDYFAVAAGITYEESKFTGSIINLDNDTIQSNSISRDFSFSPYMRIVMPLSDNQRLSFYNDIGVSFGYGRSLNRNTENLDEIEKQFSNQMVFGIGISPGVTFFAAENFAFEAGLNLIGYRMNIQNSVDGNGMESRRVEHDVNLSLNLLSMKIGVSYFF